MAPNPRRVATRLDMLYAKLPKIECQGLCHDSCGPIITSVGVAELDRVERASGKKLSCGKGASCSMLTEDRRCGVYAQRPLICRLWGLTEGLPCHYGCRPEGGLISDGAAYRIVSEMLTIAGGSPPGVEQVNKLIAEMNRKGVSDAQVRKLVEDFNVRPTLANRDKALPRTVLHRTP